MGTATAGLADALARWATELEPSEDDLALARRSLLDTVAVALAARSHPLHGAFGQLSEPGRWAALAHVLDFDDLHLPSTTHVSAVCVPVALSCGGGERAYLAGAGVMARLGTALGWRHYSAGWHATCTSGAPAAATTAAIARGLDAEAVARAIALAVPAAGGVQRAFGTAAKSLQVGFAAEAGVRAAALADAGASADPLALEQWMALVGGDTESPSPDAPAVPGGLAIKPFPCCYALQRPIAAVQTLEPVAPDRIRRICVRTPRASLAPLIHHSPQTGLEGKFSLEYGIAAALLDGRPGFDSFSDEAVRRPDAARLMRAVQVAATDGGDHLLTGEIEIEIETEARAGAGLRATLALPPGAPERPVTDGELRAKLELCAGPQADQLVELSFESAAGWLRSNLAA